MEYYPSNLKSYVNRLANYSAQTIRIFPQAGVLNAGPRQTISVNLPPSALVLPSTFTMWAQGTTTATGITNSGTTASPTCIFPQNFESLISSLSVSGNGLQLDGGPGQFYNQLWDMIADLQLGGKKTERSLLQGARDIPSQAVNNSPTTPPTAQNGSNPVYPFMPWSSNGAGTYASYPQQIAIGNWLGMMNSPELLDTDLTGQITINVGLADTNVLVINESTTIPSTATYSLNNVYFTITTISLSPEFYHAQAMYLERAVIERKMNLWWAFPGSVVTGDLHNTSGYAPQSASSATTTVAFSLASQSVDLLLGAFLTVPDNGKPILCRFDADQTDPFVQCGSSAFKGAAFRRPGHFIQDYAFSCNNIQIPTYRVGAKEAFQHLLIQLGINNEALQGTNPSIDHISKWLQAYWMCAQSFAAQAPADARLISGFSTRGTNSNFTWDVTQSTTAPPPVFNVRPTVFALTSSTLRIGKARMLEVVN